MKEALEKAFSGLQETLPLDPDDPVAVQFLSLISDLAGDDVPPESVCDLYFRLLDASDAGLCHPAEDVAHQILAQAPQFHYASILLGDCYYHNQDWSDALRHYREAAAAAPTYGRAFARIAECEDALGNQPEALANYVQAVMREPGSSSLQDSLTNYAYANSYKALLHRVQRKARVAAAANGELEIILSKGDADSDEVLAAWVAYAMKKMLLYSEAAERHPGHGLEPSFAIEQGAFAMLTSYWEEARKDKPALHDEDLDFLVELKHRQLLDAFIYLSYFRPEFRDSYSQWRTAHESDLRTLINQYLVVVDPDRVLFAKAMTSFGNAKYTDALE